jgi:hypothetical protein
MRIRVRIPPEIKTKPALAQRGLIVSSPPTSEETGAKGREIESIRVFGGSFLFKNQNGAGGSKIKLKDKGKASLEAINSESKFWLHKLFSSQLRFI